MTEFVSQIHSIWLKYYAMFTWFCYAVLWQNSSGLSKKTAGQKNEAKLPFLFTRIGVNLMFGSTHFLCYSLLRGINSTLLCGNDV